MFAERAFTVTDEPTFHCRTCLDEPAAWRFFWCQGKGKQRDLIPGERGTKFPICDCGQWRPHPPHMYVGRCECSNTNPVIGEHRRRLQEFRASKHVKRGS